MKREVLTEAAPAPVGPYSQAVAHDGLVWASGQIPLDPATGKLVAGGIDVEARQAFANLLAVLEAGGASAATLLRVTIYLTDLADFATVNEIYAGILPAGTKPARATLGVAALPLGAAIEVDAVAHAT